MEDEHVTRTKRKEKKKKKKNSILKNKEFRFRESFFN